VKREGRVKLELAFAHDRQLFAAAFAAAAVVAPRRDRDEAEGTVGG
jgi:hypothetical protein